MTETTDAGGGAAAAAQAADPCVGDLVELMGLVARADLNGSFAIVIEAETPEEDEQLKASGRLKVTSFPNTLSLKPEKLRVLSKAERGSIDWSFMDGEFPGIGPKPTIAGMMGHPTYFIGDVYDHGLLAQQLWGLVAKGAEMAPLRHIGQLERQTILNNTAAHTLYFISLDRIAHNVILETRAGMARLHQCYVQTGADENGDSFGFTTREWTTGRPDDDESPLNEEVLAARERWGAGAEPMDRARLIEFLDHLEGLEDMCEKVAKEMSMEMPKAVRELEAQFRQERQAAKSGEQVTPPKGGIFEWTRVLLDTQKRCCLKLRLGAEPGHCTVLESSDCHAEQFEPFRFDMPGPLVSPFMQAYKELIGFMPQPDVFITVLHHVYCTKADDDLEPLTGMTAKGWALRALTIPH